MKNYELQTQKQLTPRYKRGAGRGLKNFIEVFLLLRFRWLKIRFLSTQNTNYPNFLALFKPVEFHSTS
jgi:hypothetical protein